MINKYTTGPWMHLANDILLAFLRVVKANFYNPWMRAAKAVRLMVKYPQLRIHPSAKIKDEGMLLIRGPVFIGRNVEILIDEGGCVELGGHNYILDNCQISVGSETMRIGEGSSIQFGCILIGEVVIGKHCLLAPRIFVSSGSHSFRGSNSMPSWFMIKLQDHFIGCLNKRAVLVGDDCWIGINATIMPGVAIGKGCIIGASSVVTRPIQDCYGIYCGIPASKVGSRWTPPERQMSDGGILAD